MPPALPWGCTQRNSHRENGRLVAHKEQELLRFVLEISSVMGQKGETNERNRSIGVEQQHPETPRSPGLCSHSCSGGHGDKRRAGRLLC